MSVFKDGYLCVYYTKLHKQKWSHQKREIICKEILTALDIYKITHVAILVAPIHYQTPKYRRLEKAIITLCRHKRIPVIRYTTKQLLSIPLSQPYKTKKKFRGLLVGVFRELKPLYIKEVRNKQRYYYKMFDAIGIGLLAGRDVKKLSGYGRMEK